MNAYQSPPQHYLGVLAAVALHASLLIPLFYVAGQAPPRKVEKVLMSVLIGKVADRERELAPPRAAPAPPRAARPPREVPVQAAPAKQRASRQAEPDRPDAPDTSPPAQAPSSSGHAVQVPSPQASRLADTELEDLQRYLARLRKKVQERLVYPAAARRDGIEGATALRFTLLPDGSIQPGSLEVARSSGDAALDANAMQAVSAAEPFEAISRQRSVVISVSFKLSV